MQTRSQIVSNTVTAWLSTAISALVGITILPVFITYLGKDGYGLTVFAGSIVGVTTLIDFGLRGAFMRDVAELIVRRDTEGVNRLFSSALLLFGVAAGILSLILGLLAPALPKLMSIQPSHTTAARILILWFVIPSIILAFIGPLFSGIITAHGRYDVQNGIAAVAAVLRAGCAYIAIGPFAGGLTGWTIATLLAMVITFVAHVLTAVRLYPELRFVPHLADVKTVIPLASLGGYLSVLQITGFLAVQADPFILAAILGPASLALYGPASAVVGTVRPLLTAITDQLNPLATRYFAQGQTQSMRQLLIRGTKYTFALGTLCFLLLGTLAHPLCELWLGSSLPTQWVTVAQVLILWAAADLCTTATGTQWPVLLGMRRIRYVSLLRVPLTTANALASVSLVAFTNLGVAGVVIPTIFQRGVGAVLTSVYTARVCDVPARAYFVSAHCKSLIVLACVAGLSVSLQSGRSVSWPSLFFWAFSVTTAWAAMTYLFVLDKEDKALARELAVPIVMRVRSVFASVHGTGLFIR